MDGEAKKSLSTKKLNTVVADTQDQAVIREMTENSETSEKITYLLVFTTTFRPTPAA
jgi:hypothetical protein